MSTTFPAPPSSRATRPPVPGVAIAAACLALLLAACDNTATDPGGDRTPDQSPPAPDVRLKVAYDETEVTFTNVLPPDVVGQVGTSGAMSKEALENRGVMENYEAVRETKTYDGEGYLTKTYTHIDGHARLTMPEEAFRQVSDQMPRRASENPIVTFKLEDGSMQLVREDGDVAAQGSVDPEQFRMSPEKLDSLEALRETVSADERAARTRRRLQRMGLSLTALSEYHVSFETEAEEEELARVRRVVDLRHGQPVYLAYENEDGRKTRVVTRAYGRYSGLPVMRREVSYDYGPKEGGWAVVARTETTRENISVQFNSR